MKQLVLILSVFIGLVLLVGCGGSSNATPVSADTTTSSVETIEDADFEITETSVNDSAQTIDPSVQSDAIQNSDNFGS